MTTRRTWGAALVAALAAMGCAGDDTNHAGPASADAGSDATIASDGGNDATTEAAPSDATSGDDAADAIAFDGETCDLHLKTPTAQCDQCVGDFCCAVANACADDGDAASTDPNDDTCMNARQCRVACELGDAGEAPDAAALGACYTQCTSKYPNGSPKLQQLVQCLDANCIGTDAAPGACAAAFDGGL